MISIRTRTWQVDKIEAVLFDKDGTFIDLNTYWGRIIELRVKAVMAEYSLSDKLFYELCFSLGLDNKLHKLHPKGPIALLSKNEVIKVFFKKLTKYNIRSSEKELSDIFGSVNVNFQKEMYKYVKLLPGTLKLFETLKQCKIKMGVITSDTKENTKQILDHLGIERYFDIVMGRGDCKEAKKTGMPATHAVEYLCISRERTLVIGDAPMDSLMAKKAGLKGSILVATGQLPIEELNRYSLYTLNDLTQMEVIKTTK